MAVVYKHINNYTGEPFYVGIGRKLSRAYCKYHRSYHWNNIVKKYGYTVEFYFLDISWEQAKLWEKFLIKLYGRQNLETGILCNLTDGGDGTVNYKATKDTKLKQSLANKGVQKSLIARKNMKNSFTIERKGEISKRVSGNNNPMYGKTHTKEIRKRLSIRFSGANNARAKSIIDLETGIIYGSIRECSRKINMSLTNIIYKLKVKNERFNYISTNSVYK